jgi:hypothetical protein
MDRFDDAPGMKSGTAGRNRGVFILANDVVLEYAIALFRSLRNFSPDIPARLIPYDDRLSQLTPWMERYGIELHEDADYGFYDRLGDTLWDCSRSGHRMFRKFAAFSGQFDDFLYLDVDIAVLAPVEALFDEFTRSGCDFFTFDNDMERVYFPGKFRDDLVASGRTKGFNAGAFMSRKGAFVNSELPGLVDQAKIHRTEFQDVLDQTFFNFAVDIKGLHQVRLPEVNTSYADKQWGDLVPYREVDGVWRLMTPGHADCGKRQPFIHWSGHNDDDPFPNREVFYHFRLLGEPQARRWRYRLRDLWRWWGVRQWKKVVDPINEAKARARIRLGAWRQSLRKAPAKVNSPGETDASRP